MGDPGMKKIFIILFTFIFVYGAAYFIWLLPYSFIKVPIRIAVVGPMDLPNGNAMRKGVVLYKDRINRQGGVHGRKVKLLFYDDKNDPAAAEKIAYEIARDNNVYCVIGHYYSSTSAAAGMIYKRNEIPAITASATAESVIFDNEWYFRVIPGNALEARFVANYISKGLKTQSVSIIFTKDGYGISLAENFEKTVKSLGMKMAGKWAWDNDKSSDDQLAVIKEELIATDDPGIIYLATHAAEGVKILTGLKDAGKSYPVIGSYAFARSFFIELKPYSREWSDPGYYSNGVYFITPFMSDIGPEVRFYQDVMIKNTSLGNPEFFGTEHKLSYSQFNAEILIEKKFSAAFISLKFLPVFLSVLGLCLIFSVPAKRMRRRLLIIIFILSINTIFYLLQLADMPVEYFTVLDYGYFFIYILIILSALMSAFTYRLQKEGSRK
jgi:ABC-type branched-subunit amino acid transport system substrate-binding protein